MERQQLLCAGLPCSAPPAAPGSTGRVVPDQSQAVTTSPPSRTPPGAVQRMGSNLIREMQCLADEPSWSGEEEGAPSSGEEVGGPLSVFSQGTSVMGSSGAGWLSRTMGGQGLVRGSRQELTGSAARSHSQEQRGVAGSVRVAGRAGQGWHFHPRCGMGLGTLGPAWQGIRTHLSFFALCTVVFILGGFVPPAENFVFHMGAGHIAGAPQSPLAGGPMVP